MKKLFFLSILIFGKICFASSIEKTITPLAINSQNLGGKTSDYFAIKEDVYNSTTTLQNVKIDKFENVIFRPATSTTTVQQIINSINDNCATCQYLIKLDYGCVDEDIILEPYVSLEGFGYDGTIISSITILFNFPTSVPELTDTVVLKNLVIQNFFDVSLRNNYKTLSLLHSIVRSSAVFRGDNTTEIYNFTDTTFEQKPTFSDSLLLDSEGCKYAQGIDFFENIEAQHNNGEINGFVTINDSCTFSVRNAGVKSTLNSIFAEYILNNNSILDIDYNTGATAIITNNTGNIENVKYISGVNAGIVEPAPYIEDNSDGKINIGDTDCFLYDNSSQFGVPRRFSVVGVSSQTLVDNAENFILINYNSGNPVYQFSTTNTSNVSDIILVGSVYRKGIELHTKGNDALGSGLAEKILDWIQKTNPNAKYYGINLATTVLRGITISEGVSYNTVTPIEFDYFNSTATAISDFDFYYTTNSGVNWIDLRISSYLNTVYQTPTGLVNLLPNQFVAAYIYRGLESEPHAYYILGGNHLTSAGAISETIPDNKPPIIVSHGVYVGKLIIEQGQSASQVIPAVTTTQGASGTTLHPSLAGLNDGTNGVGGHANVFNKNGLAGGQTLIGGTGAGDNLTLQSTANATKGNVFISTWAVFNTTNQSLAIGTTNTAGPLRIARNDLNAGIVSDVYSNDSTKRSPFNFRRFGGSESSPTAVDSDYQIFIINCNAYDGSDSRSVSSISSNVDAFNGVNNISGYLSFATRPSGIGATLTERFLITSSGTIFANSLSGSTGESDLRYNTTTKEIFYDTSSEIYKENISTTTSTDWVYNTTVKQFNRIGDSEIETGLIAEDLELIKPEIVNYALFEKQGNDFVLISKTYKNISNYYDISPNIEVEANLIIYNDETKSEVSEQKIIMKRPVGINYNAFIPAILKELQLLKARVDVLEGN